MNVPLIVLCDDDIRESAGQSISNGTRLPRMLYHNIFQSFNIMWPVHAVPNPYSLHVRNDDKKCGLYSISHDRINEYAQGNCYLDVLKWERQKNCIQEEHEQVMFIEETLYD